MKMNRIVELSNIEKPIECCRLNITTNETTFYRGTKKVPGFTGLYYSENNGFVTPDDGIKIFAIYPTQIGPVVYYEDKEYEINRELTITLSKEGKNRIFRIADYNIEVNYIESPYIGMDSWSDEIDVDLFFMIEQRYQDQDFYDQYSL